jgi:hypothetical protein
MNDSGLLCVRCGRPVEQEADNHETFERMHWLCFQYEFEPEGDPDIEAEPVGVPQPPSLHVRTATGKWPPPSSLLARRDPSEGFP